MSHSPADPPPAADPPAADKTNWRNIVANVIIAIVAIATALPAELGEDSDFSIWLGSSQVVGVIVILQALLRIPPLSRWVNGGGGAAASPTPHTTHKPPAIT